MSRLALMQHPWRAESCLWDWNPFPPGWPRCLVRRPSETRSTLWGSTSCPLGRTCRRRPALLDFLRVHVRFLPRVVPMSTQTILPALPVGAIGALSDADIKISRRLDDAERRHGIPTGDRGNELTDGGFWESSQRERAVNQRGSGINERSPPYEGGARGGVFRPRASRSAPLKNPPVSPLRKGGLFLTSFAANRLPSLDRKKPPSVRY